MNRATSDQFDDLPAEGQADDDGNGGAGGLRRSRRSSVNSCSSSISANASSSRKSKNPKANNSVESAKIQKSTTNKLEFRFGPYVPILRPDKSVVVDVKGIVSEFSGQYPNSVKNRLISEVLPDDAIVEAPSLVTPLLLKKKTVWPPKNIEEPATEPMDVCEDDPSQAIGDSDEVQVVKVIKKELAQIIENKNLKPVREYIKTAAVASLTNSPGIPQITTPPILTIEDYYKSSAGEFLLGIGLSRVLEMTNEETIRKLNRVIRRNDDYTASKLTELDSAKARQQSIKNSNQPFKPQKIYSCPHCDFKTEFQVVLDGHLEYPHMARKNYLCNWCDFRTKEPNEFVYHNIYQHRKRCVLERPPSNHNCHLCPFETKSKRKLVSHLAKCVPSFNLESSLSPRAIGELDFPGVTSKLITQEDVKNYDETLKSLRLAAYNPHQLNVPIMHQGSMKQSSIYVLPRPPGVSQPGFQQAVLFNRPNAGNPNQISSVPTRPNAVITSADLTRSTEPQSPTNSQLMTLLASHNITVAPTRSANLQHPPVQSSFANGRAVIRSTRDLMMTSHQSNGQSSNQASASNHNDVQSAQTGRSPKGSTFVICEICDAYIKDLNELKAHMQDTHKVKIMRKMLASRPPLSCQKCQWRFFTDQGLERHLLGAHGLVTSNMQDLVEHELDAGRCSVCGKAYASKLVAHMKDFHKLNLKPAHLSYKCTVCSATFNLYRLFEDHVYSVHRDTVRKTPGKAN